LLEKQIDIAHGLVNHRRISHASKGHVPNREIEGISPDNQRYKLGDGGRAEEGEECNVM
jgi:hypothetical protein